MFLVACNKIFTTSARAEPHCVVVFYRTDAKVIVLAYKALSGLGYTAVSVLRSPFMPSEVILYFSITAGANFNEMKS